MAEIKSSWAVCSVCGKEFEIVGNRKKYCSKACCAEASRKKSCERGKARYRALTAEQKKEVEVESKLYCRIIDGGDGSTVRSEALQDGINLNDEIKEMLAKYCSEHVGDYFAVCEKRWMVKQ